MDERFLNVDPEGRPLQDVYGGLSATARSPEREPPPGMPAAASSGEVHNGGPSPVVGEAREQGMEQPARSIDQPAYDGGAAPTDLL